MLKTAQSLRNWVRASLTRKFVVLVIGASVGLCLVVIVLLVGLYRAELEVERQEASMSVNRLLEASLENAMLKRDLDGLRGIVERLGQQDGIQSVMIVNPSNEVRFSSLPDLLGKTFTPTTDVTCSGCHSGEGPISGETAFLRNERGQEVLRSVIPVHNKAPCVECHGTVADNPINGVLFVDYDAGTIREKALHSAFLLAGSGGLVGLLTFGVSVWFFRRFVLRPVTQLENASRAVAAGRLAIRTRVDGNDELGRLGHTFDSMAERLKDSRERIEAHDRYLQALIDAVPDGIRLIDSDFTILNTNLAYCAQLGLRSGEANGSKCFKSSHGRDTPCPPTLITCPIHEIARTGQPLKTIQQHVRADGTTFQVEVVAAPVSIQVEGKERSVIVESVRDLSRQVKFSQEQRLAEIDRLASGVAHEIRNPLASIRLALQAALRCHETETPGPPAMYESLSSIDGEIDKCIQITERLLKLSSTPEERPQLVEINSVVTETLSLLAFEADQADIRVEKNLDSANPRVIASDSEMRMLVLNLVQNALHAMPQGGCVTITSEQGPEEIVLCVEDTGTGIMPEDIPYIYDPFFSHRADGIKGTGLGLTMCKAIVARHKGRMSFTTQLELGTRFKICLPSADRVMETAEDGYEEQRLAN